jgi:hypothetical protein
MLHVLRAAIGIVGAAMLLAGLALLAAGGVLAWPGLQLAVVGSLGILIAVFERLRYGRERGSGSEMLRPTDERFIDPTSGVPTRVWIDPASGERTYLPDGEQPQE